MKYDDASWYLEGAAADDDHLLEENAGTHIALMLKWCCLRGFANPAVFPADHAGLLKLQRGELSARDFLFDDCDGKLDSESFTAEGNAFLLWYLGTDGDFMLDYSGNFADQLLVGGEAEHDFAKFSEMVERRYQQFLTAKSRPAARPWWKFWN